MGLFDFFKSDRPKWEHRNQKVRLAAVQELEDQSILIKIAIAGIKDETALIDIAMNLSNYGIDSKAAQAAIARINNDEILADIAEKKLYGSAVEKIENRDILKRLAKNAERWHIREAAVKKIHDENFIAKVACNDPDADVRSAALERIKNQELLENTKQNELVLIKNSLQEGITEYDAIELLGHKYDRIDGEQVLRMSGQLGAKTRHISSQQAMFMTTNYYSWKRPEGEYMLVIQNNKIKRIYSIPECTLRAKSTDINAPVKEKQTSQNDDFTKKISDFMAANELTIGTYEQFKLGQQDFSNWGSGVIIGSKEIILNRLSNILAPIETGHSSIGCTQDFSWQNSKLEGFTFRIEVAIPAGLAGFYIGRLGENRFGIFGCGINNDEELDDPK